MNADKITKLYPGLTDKERAVLAFAYLIHGDHAEHARVAAHRSSWEFRSWSIGLQNLALFWGLEHWRNRCIMLACATAARATADESGIDDLLAKAGARDRHLQALDQALIEVCTEHNIDETAVRLVAAVADRHEGYQGETPTADAVAEVKVALLTILLP